VLGQISNIIGRLRTFPRLGHQAIVDGTIERVVPRTLYVIVYRLHVSDTYRRYRS
jgi:hypothetical protein